jgi:hypothetical protein
VDIQALIAKGYKDKDLADKLAEERINKIAEWLEPRPSMRW